jgi:hypothetical protein
MWRKGNPPHVTDRKGHNSIDDFPLVPEQPKVIVELVGLDHPDHPINREKRAKEEAGRLRSQLEQDAIRTESAVSAAEPSPAAPETKPAADSLESQPVADQLEADPTSDPSDEFGLSKPAREYFRKATPQQLHELRCSVCAHPFRAMIEEEFLHWISPEKISKQYDIGWRCIYRHAHATGLYKKRYENLRSSLGHIVEYAGELCPTSRDVIRAVHHLARINAKGQWTEPTKRVVLSTEARPAAPAPPIPAAAGDPTRIDIPPAPIEAEGSERSEPRDAARIRKHRRAPKPPNHPSRKTR